MGCNSLGIVLTVLETITYFTKQGTLLIFPVFFYFCFIQALEFRIRYITCKLASRPSRWTGLHRGCANLRACDLGTSSYPASASNALLLSAIPAASHLDIEKYWTWHYTTEMLLKFQVFWLLWYVTEWKVSDISKNILPSTHQKLPSQWHSITSHKTWTFWNTAVRTP